MWMGERAVFWRVSVGLFLGVSGRAGEEACPWVQRTRDQRH